MVLQVPVCDPLVCAFTWCSVAISSLYSNFRTLSVYVSNILIRPWKRKASLAARCTNRRSLGARRRKLESPPPSMSSPLTSDHNPIAFLEWEPLPTCSLVFHPTPFSGILLSRQRFRVWTISGAQPLPRSVYTYHPRECSLHLSQSSGTYAQAYVLAR